MEDIPRNPYFILLFSVVYIYSSLCLMTIAHKLERTNLWMAWIPVINIYYFLSLARRPGWWMLLIAVPFFNIAVATYAFMAIAERRGRPAWWGMFFLLPPAGLLLQGALAFSDNGHAQPHHSSMTTPRAEA